MALEWVLEKIIMKTLGEYLNNDDQNKLRIGIQNGDTTLRKIELNVSAFNELDLPVHIKKVSIETLEIKIQLKNLRTQPITIKIKTVEVEAVPCENIGKSKQESEMSKDDKKGTSKKGKNKDSKKRSSSEKLLAAFIKNVNIELEDIHVHLDVAHTTSKELSTIGVRMKNFLFKTTDEKWRPCQVKTKLNNNFKLLEMKGLAVYWKCNNTDRGKAETSEATSQTSVKLDTTSTKADRKEKQTKNNTETFLIEPISCEAHLELNLKPGDIKHSRPVAFLQIELNKIGIQLSKRMYDDILLMVEHFEKLKSKNKGSPNANPLQHDKISSVPERQNSSDKKTESLGKRSTYIP